MTAATIDTATRRKLADLLERLGSDHAGEREAAARAIVRTLEGAGTDLHTLADEIRRDPRDDDVHPERERWTDWRQMVEAAIAAGLARNQWERSFLAGLRDWTGDEITTKQQTVLNRIYTRGGSHE